MNEPKMFCFQCQGTAGNKGCTICGVCGKTADVAALQDELGARMGCPPSSPPFRQAAFDVAD